mgnify:FL=1|tara:strand:+ start:1223 stop:2092 length:870 start_codon:yes stop_codon:yes gene_type:complete
MNNNSSNASNGSNAGNASNASNGSNRNNANRRNNNNNRLEDFVGTNNNKRSNKALNRLTNKLNKTRKRARNAVSAIKNTATDTVATGTKGVDFSLLDIAKIFGGLLIFPPFATEPPMKECDGESGYQKRYDELMEESMKQSDEMANDFTEVGSYLTVSPLEQSIFLKRQIKVDCVPVEPKLEPNSKAKDEVCWDSIECKTGLKCNNKEKYIKGVCEEGGVKKIDTEKGGNCGADVECKDDLVCNGNYFKKIVGKGTCGDLQGDGADNSSKKAIENKNKISNESGFVGES